MPKETKSVKMKKSKPQNNHLEDRYYYKKSKEKQKCKKNKNKIKKNKKKSETCKKSNKLKNFTFAPTISTSYLLSNMAFQVQFLVEIFSF